MGASASLMAEPGLHGNQSPKVWGFRVFRGLGILGVLNDFKV